VASAILPLCLRPVSIDVELTLSAIPFPQDVIRQVSGSFRDPSGFVCVSDGVLYRVVNECYRPHYERLLQSGLATDLMDSGFLIRHEEVSAGAKHSLSGYKVLRPERVPFISYPYEWSFSQLRDAAMLTLRIQKRALKFGMSLKDASAYNVQFLRGKPIFIDTLSFETVTEGRPWVGYRQFCQHFLAPLALMAYCDVRLSQLLRVFLDGVPLDLASGLLPRRTRLKPSLAMHVHLHARAQKRYGGRPVAAGGRQLSRTALVALLDNLASAIRSLRWKPQGTEWSDYYRDTNYSEPAIAQKERLVVNILGRLRPATVWDLGANVGRFSRLASRSGITTMAFDADPAAVEQNYLESRRTEDEHLLPLVVDLTNPSTSLGWAGAERLSLQERGPADVALALALIHHLAIGNNVPFARVAEWLSRIARHVVIEFVPKTDSQVQRMLASRTDIFERYTQSAFEEDFDAYFAIEARESIPRTERLLYHMRRR
jgi:hypothetical protein